MPWKWEYPRSKGRALTSEEEKNGFGLRFSPKKRTKGRDMAKCDNPMAGLYPRKREAMPQPVSEASVGGQGLQPTFESLFSGWAEEAVHCAGFPAETPEHGRIPLRVKEKVASLWGQGLLSPGEKPASFRIADAKRGGPYKWFSHYASNKTIYTNHEYFVQVAAFYDLIHEYGYPPHWMAFEHNESAPPVSIAIDIGIKFPDGRKAFVEVKEKKDQLQALIEGVKFLGQIGVDLRAPDRGNDPLRKAKYIAAGRPYFFVGYCPDGFESYKVTYLSENRFTLIPAILPKASELGS